MQDPVIDIRNLSFAYNDHLVLEDVNMRVSKGEFLALLGPNGGGKTTLIRIILGILPYRQGEIRLMGHPPGHLPHLLGYVPQSMPKSEKFPINVLDAVLLGRIGHLGRWSRFSGRDIEIARQCLNEVGMLEYEKRPMDTLSGGQRQRVLIARALAGRPEILFMDEPTAAVDQAFHPRLYSLLKKLNENGTTIAVISHDLSVLSSHVKAVACINRHLYYHHAAEITQDMLEKVYHCPVELIAHGHIPHRVLKKH